MDRTHGTALHRPAPHQATTHRTAPHCILTRDAVLRANLFLDPTLAIFYAIASIVSIIALAIKVRVFMQQLRERRNELSVLDEGTLTVQQEKLQKHVKRLVKTTRTIHMTYASMMLGIAECIPLGLLQGRFSKHSVFVHLLLVCSCALTAPTRQMSIIIDVYGLTHHHLVIQTDRSRACPSIEDLTGACWGSKCLKFRSFMDYGSTRPVVPGLEFVMFLLRLAWL